MDPIVRSRLDTDTYKFLMGQVIDQKHPLTQVRFSLTNRSKGVRLADIVDEAELREQLDHARTLRYTKSELIWLRGQTFFGDEGIFKPGYITSLAHDGHAPNGADIIGVHCHFHDKTNPTFGWGTMLTNDFIDWVPATPFC